MRPGNSISSKIMTLPQLQQRLEQWRVMGRTVAFTNGCFDILHAGHIASLTAAAQEADYLVVGLNADTSVKALKGAEIPVNGEAARAQLLAALAMVDAVIVFTEETPRNLIVALKPDVLVKGGDYKVEDIAGAQEVISWGGRVVINPILPGHSTTGTIEKIQKGK
ncbi:MAG: D-glycero-beta-D-manno-heptose 1-phosphate adenylyltransferase [Chitinophagaceae bacterium]